MVAITARRPSGVFEPYRQRMEFSVAESPSNTKTKQLEEYKQAKMQSVM